MRFRVTGKLFITLSRTSVAIAKSLDYPVRQAVAALVRRHTPAFDQGPGNTAGKSSFRFRVRFCKKECLEKWRRLRAPNIRRDALRIETFRPARLESQRGYEYFAPLSGDP